MSEHKDTCAVQLLMAALESALCYGDLKRVAALVTAGADWAHAASGEDEAAAWRRVAAAAGWVGGMPADAI